MSRAMVGVLVGVMLLLGGEGRGQETKVLDLPPADAGQFNLPQPIPPDPNDPVMVLLRPGPARSNERSHAPDPDSSDSDLIVPPLDPAILAQVSSFLPKLADIQPLPEPVISDDPPPHENNLIDWPLRIAPPDLLIVEVSGPLSGPPITGDRLVRFDGTITLGYYGDVHVRGLTVAQAKTKIILKLREFLDDQTLGLIEKASNGDVNLIRPELSNRVFVDIGTYNSTVYYVQGDVNSPGRLPFTGNDTVLDALNYAGHLQPIGDRKNIILVRPARGDRPAKTYPIDLDAILDRGDAKANLQLFPGDRLLVGRAPIVTQTIQIDRVAAPVNTAMSTMNQLSFMLKNMNAALEGVPKERRAEVYRGMLDLFVDWAMRPDWSAPEPKELGERFEAILGPIVMEGAAKAE